MGKLWVFGVTFEVKRKLGLYLPHLRSKGSWGIKGKLCVVRVIFVVKGRLGAVFTKCEVKGNLGDQCEAMGCPCNF